MNLEAKIEAILFASAKPFSVRKLSDLTGASTKEIEAALDAMKRALDEAESGVMLQKNGSEFELVTRPEAAEVVEQVVKAEAQGELTRPSLEALTILAYRGPLTRPELEQVRGVQSSMILRNLMLRGLVEEREDTRLGQPIYAVTFEFLNHLGVSSVEDLPDYESLRGHAAVSDVLAQLEPSNSTPSESLPIQSV
jgi:segregation and condensation protein B